MVLTSLIAIGCGSGVSPQSTTAAPTAGGGGGGSGGGSGIWKQQGTRLVGAGNIGNSQQGQSVALSSDGNTAVVGATDDDSQIGAVWVFTRSGLTWSEQAKLVGTGNIGTARQGASVSISADGNTVLIGGSEDDGQKGAAWVFTRTSGVWTQQGGKLVGAGSTGPAQQGHRVSLSADGNTALIGGIGDNSFQGAAWVFTRSGGVWTQEGSKLVGTGNSGAALQGTGVSLSADGNTALIGGQQDDSQKGAAWVFTRSGGVWTQEGSKLVGTGNSFSSRQGSSVSLSANGNIALIGAPNDAGGFGAAWVFVRSGSIWTQQGNKLVGTSVAGNPGQGFSVSLSADGNTALMGGPAATSSLGAAWVFVQ